MRRHLTLRPDQVIDVVRLQLRLAHDLRSELLRPIARGPRSARPHHAEGALPQWALPDERVRIVEDDAERVTLVAAIPKQVREALLTGEATRITRGAIAFTGRSRRAAIGNAVPLGKNAPRRAPAGAAAADRWGEIVAVAAGVVARHALRRRTEAGLRLKPVDVCAAPSVESFRQEDVAPIGSSSLLDLGARDVNAPIGLSLPLGRDPVVVANHVLVLDRGVRFEQDRLRRTPQGKLHRRGVERQSFSWLPGAQGWTISDDAHVKPNASVATSQREVQLHHPSFAVAVGSGASAKNDARTFQNVARGPSRFALHGIPHRRLLGNGDMFLRLLSPG
mmetsp:Transcript_59033/g.164942  ORF Transcript_59033/g.164942 Transcript_59033/m.164942 type:complete len:335 (+) Transcript_59033:810-1814(+)